MENITNEEYSIDNKLQVVFDMETGDPDDFICLLWLLAHPFIKVKAVTITPGSLTQVTFVKSQLKELNLDHIEVGAFNIRHTKECVSRWHYNAYKKPAPMSADDTNAIREGWQVLLDNCDGMYAVCFF